MPFARFHTPLYQCMSVFLNNSLVAGNQAAVSGPDISSPAPFTITSNGFNFIGTTSGISNAGSLQDKTFANTGTTLVDLVQTNAGIAVLTNNGGPTDTIALIEGSPAINGGRNANAAGLEFDQRGPGFF